jgi:hypothetical protein
VRLYYIQEILKMAAIRDIALCSLVEVERRFRDVYQLHHTVLMIKAVLTSDTSIFCNKSNWRYILEWCDLHIRLSENLKSHKNC